METENISNTTVKKLTGGYKRNTLHFVLIGQIGKHIDLENEVKSQITIGEIVNYIMEVVFESHKYIPCKYVMVECLDSLKELYSNLGFKYLQKDGEYNQYTKMILED